MRKKIDGLSYLDVPTPKIHIDISISGLEYLIGRYIEEYGENPSSLLYGPDSLFLVTELYESEAHLDDIARLGSGKLPAGVTQRMYKAREILRHRVLIPTWPQRWWGVSGPKGLVLTEEA